MSVDKRHWITNGAEIVQSGDLVRLRGDDGEWSEWGSADHLAGSRVDSFVQWHWLCTQFARVPPANIAQQAQQFGDQFRRWQQESAPDRGDEWITDPTVIIQPGDLYRVREDSHTDYCDWRPADHYAGTEVGYFAAWHSRDIQFCRPARPAVEPAPEQPPAPTTDRGSKYHRTITQTLPGDTCGCSVTIDVYDVLEAFRVRCPALQHAIKKLLCAGMRGSKSAEQDISEAANSCRRAIELLRVDL
jgi:hypothetical protein